MQYDIFQNTAYQKIGRKSKSNWSYSKGSLLSQCARKYYYQYYGSNKRVATSEKDKERLIALKRLSNKYMVQGKTIHDAIKIYFNKLKEGDKWDFDKLLWWAQKVYKDSIRYSRDYRIGQSEGKYPPEVLKEIVVLGEDWRQIEKEGEEKIRTSLSNFFNSSKNDFLRSNGANDNSIIEGRSNFNLTDNISVDGKVDIAFKSDDVFYIADWKTGKNEYQGVSLQLIVYVLWAIEKGYGNLDNIKIYKSYLFIDKIEQLGFNNYELLRGKMRIVQEVEKMRLLDKYGKQGRSEAFTKCNKEKICRQCPFQEVCQMN